MDNHENEIKKVKSINTEEDRKYIFRPWITKNGEKVFAKTYGKKAFKIYID